jgi:hypothetical protein
MNYAGEFMNIIEPITCNGYDELIANIDAYKEAFIAQGILLFRGVNASIEEQAQIQIAFGTHFNCFPNANSDPLDFYTEDHSRSQKQYIGKPDEIILDWHIEHQYFDNHMVVGF